MKVNELTIEPGEIYGYAVALMDEKDIDHHGLGKGMDDLYLRKNKISDFLISKLTTKSLLETFVDNIEHDIWYDLPFCYPIPNEKSFCPSR